MKDDERNSEYSLGDSMTMSSEQISRLREEDDDPQMSLADMVGWAIGAMRRRRWWVLSTFFVVVVACAVIIALLPNKYQSESTLVVARSRIPERFAERMNIFTAEEELAALQREILSRKRLVEIINSVGLYKDKRAKVALDALAEHMRKDIVVEPIRVSPQSGISEFRLTFTGGDPRLAHEVVSRLSSLFIEENLRTQDANASTTARFLLQNLESAKQRLTEQEAKIRDFKMQNLGQLPEQQQIVLSSLTELRIEQQTNSARLGRSRQQQIDLESAIQGFIARTESEKATLLARFTARHPEVVKKERDTEQAKVLLNQLKSGSRPPDRLPSSVGPDDPWIAQIRSQIETNVQEVANATTQEQRIQSQIAQLQARLNLSPVREQQLNELMRDYESFRQDYNDLLGKQLRYQQTASLEDQQQGNYYRLVDPPTLPEKPSSPKRPLLCLGAIAVGLGLGIAFAILIENLHPTYREEGEIKKDFGIPLVVGLPIVLSSGAIWARRKGRVFEALAGSAMLIVVAVIVLYAARTA